MLLGLLRPSAGKFCGFGIDVAQNPTVRQEQVEYVPQSIYVLDDTIENNIAFGTRENRIDHR